MSIQTIERISPAGRFSRIAFGNVRQLAAREKQEQNAIIVKQLQQHVVIPAQEQLPAVSLACILFNWGNNLISRVVEHPEKLNQKQFIELFPHTYPQYQYQTGVFTPKGKAFRALLESAPKGKWVQEIELRAKMLEKQSFAKAQKLLKSSPELKDLSKADIDSLVQTMFAIRADSHLGGRVGVDQGKLTFGDRYLSGFEQSSAAKQKLSQETQQLKTLGFIQVATCQGTESKKVYSQGYYLTALGIGFLKAVAPWKLRFDNFFQPDVPFFGRVGEFSRSDSYGE